MTNTPIVKLELQNMRHTIMTALSQHSADISNLVQAQVDELCTPEYVNQIIGNQVAAMMKTVLEREIESYFVYGDGREVIKEELLKRLERNE